MTETLPLAVLQSAAELRAAVAGWRRSGQRIGLVPTMGNLHDGHLSLVRYLRPHCERIVVSIFVNPLQFAPDEDFAAYPRTLAADTRLLASAGADVVFAPTVGDMYPEGGVSRTRVSVPELEGLLCGAHRDGHFSGVATVVAKLFNLVAPDVAVFGEKDFQQVALIRQMSRDLCFPIEILAAPTRRDPDGLAMSSRNQYLTAREREVAPGLYGALCELRDALAAAPGQPVAPLETNAQQVLEAAGMQVDYVSVRDAVTLAPDAASGDERVVLAAARLGRARLIDNLRIPAAGDQAG